MYGFNLTPVNSNYAQALSTPNQGTGFGFGSGSSYNTGGQYSNQMSNTAWNALLNQWLNNTDNGAVMPATGQQASVASQQPAAAAPATGWGSGTTQPATGYGAAPTAAQPTTEQPVTEQQQVVVAQPAATSGLPALTDAVWTGETGVGDVVAATQYVQDPYVNLPDNIRSAIARNPGVAAGIIENYQQSLLPYGQRMAMRDTRGPYARDYGFGFRADRY